jgi:hypothetical protein|tara:strand:- start:476 stop:676 length:201 start_codon:yes stop_codon:yes gene_type:complete
MTKEKWRKGLLTYYLEGKEAEEVCPKCGKKGGTCGPDCDCDAEEAQAEITRQQRDKAPPLHSIYRF